MNELTNPEQVKADTVTVAEPPTGPEALSEAPLPKETKHKQVSIQWNGQQEEVDEGLADLILALWTHSIDTMNSCQEWEPGVAWIEFLRVADALAFLNLVAHHPAEDDLPCEQTLYGRINQLSNARGWQYEVELWDQAEGEGGPVEFEFSVSIFFPADDIAVVLDSLREQHLLEKELGR